MKKRKKKKRTAINKRREIVERRNDPVIKRSSRYKLKLIVKQIKMRWNWHVVRSGNPCFRETLQELCNISFRCVYFSRNYKAYRILKEFVFLFKQFCIGFTRTTDKTSSKFTVLLIYNIIKFILLLVLYLFSKCLENLIEKTDASYLESRFLKIVSLILK